MKDFITIVSGFGRCGSSLVMQMLDAGGIPGTGEYPAFEDDRTAIDRDPKWIAEQHGKAVKLLDPHNPFGEILPENYRVIWLTRDHRQQSLSQVKFARLMMGLRLDRNAARSLAASYRKDTPVALKILNKLGPVMNLSFEKLISQPTKSAQRIRDHLGRGDVVAMADQVRSRPSKNAVGIDMELNLHAEYEATKLKKEAV